ncbi:MAG: TIGR00269 family protein [Nitrospirae bacterium]|nr:TIGR00269 family protein [Nitrospirota bacterium]
MRCRRCGARAVLKMPRHNTSVCAACLNDYVVEQVKRAIKDHTMFGRGDRILVAVSGGKDSLSLWDILMRLGYDTAGLHIQQGIGDYSEQSHQKTAAFAESRGAELILHSLKEKEGAGVLELADLTDRSPCSACGVMKRYNFNKIACDRGFDVLATGHNLDDEASRLLGNVLRWQEDYLAKQFPALQATHEKFVKKVKPLYRLAEREITAYAVVNKIDYVIEECPMSVGSKMFVNKEVLNRLETDAPGTKQAFYFGFLERQKQEDLSREDETIRSCTRCGQPTTAAVCSYCRILEKVKTAP